MWDFASSRNSWWVGCPSPSGISSTSTSGMNPTSLRLIASENLPRYPLEGRVTSPTTRCRSVSNRTRSACWSRVSWMSSTSNIFHLSEGPGVNLRPEPVLVLLEDDRLLLRDRDPGGRLEARLHLHLDAAGLAELGIGAAGGGDLHFQRLRL